MEKPKGIKTMGPGYRDSYRQTRHRCSKMIRARGLGLL
jgi:hypothetical protein